MARGGKRKCKICGEWIENNNDSVSYKKGYAHEHCFNIAMKAVVEVKKKEIAQQSKSAKAPKPQKELKEGLTEEEYREKQQLCNYMRNLIKEDLPIAAYQLMEDYKKKYKISYKEMHEDLQWYFELGDHSVEGDLVIAVVPRCHTEAQKYYDSIRIANASCREHLKELPNMYKETVATASGKRELKQNQIDISAIGSE